MTMSRNASVLAAVTAALFAWPSPSRAGDAPFYVRKATWHETMVASLEALARSKPEAAARTPLPNFGKGPYTVAAWIRTRRGGTVVAKAPAKGGWIRQGKSIFIADGKLCYDIGWEGCVRSERRVADGKWHHIAVVGRPPELRFYVDGRRDTTGRLKAQPDHKSWPTKIGYTSDGFGGAFRGELDEVRIYNRALSADEIAKTTALTASGLVGKWSFEGSANDESGSGNHAVPKGKTGF
ncbi:MAG: LamG domain-containing protein, partial [Planctomycetota bacterium]